MPKQTKAPKELSSGCLSLFGLPFMLAGLFMTGLYFNGYLSWIKAKTWQETPCWIEKADLESGSDSKGRATYKATASYRYQFSGQTYHSTQVGLGSGSDNIGDFQQNAHRELAEHARKSQIPSAPPSFRCYVNPDNPKEAVLYRNLRWEMQAFLAIFALTFPAVGTGLVIGGIIGARTQKREHLLRENYPAEPWKWKHAWMQQPIPENASFWALALHSYTLWSGAIVFSLIAAIATAGLYGTDPKPWLTMIFVALWCIPGWFSFKRLRHKLAVGSAGFEAGSLPYSPGGQLVGAVVVKRPPACRLPVEFTLTCEKSTTTRKGKNKSSTSKVNVWSKTETVSCDAVSNGIGGYRIPLSIAIPADAPESSKDTNDGETIEHQWLLTFNVPGTPIKSRFELPVFHTADSPAPLASTSAPAVSMINEALADLPARLTARRLQVIFDDREIPLEIVCPASRNPGAALSLFIFNLIWTGTAIILFQKEAPWILRAGCSISAAAMWWGVFWYLAHQRKTTLDTYSLSVRNQLGPIAWNCSLEKISIREFNVCGGAQSNNTHFYKVRAESLSGKRHVVADNLTDKHTAEALASRLNAWHKGE